MSDVLAKVIDAALEEGLSISFKGNVSAHIAAAVAAHLLGDDVIERAAVAEDAIEEVWMRTNDMRKDGQPFEVCFHTDPEVVSPKVVRAFAVYERAEAFVQKENSRRRVRAAIAAAIGPTPRDK